MLCLCIESTSDADVDERWLQYWHDNGQQLVWNDWLQKYPEYNDDSHCSSDELVVRDTVLRTCQPSENTNTVENENEVSAGSSYAVDGKTTMLFVNGQSGSVDGADSECFVVDCENHVKYGELTVESCRNAANITNIKNGSNDSLTCDGLKHSSAADISSDQVIVADRVDGAGNHRHGSWDSLWQQHYAEMYWYYYDWFMQWLNEERQMMLQSCNHTEQFADHITDDMQQLATEACGLHDDLSPASHNTCVSTSQESVNIIESLLNELLLTVVDSVSYRCPTDGNGRKRRKKKGKQYECGLFGIFVLLLSDVTTVSCGYWQDLIAANLLHIV